MNERVTLSLLAVLVLLNYSQGYTYRGKAEMKDGYCDLREYGFGSIAVGETGFNDVKCEKADCSHGTFEAYGCGRMMYDKEKCHEEPGTGHYPKCCPRVICE